jgi:hypothetical protein
MAAFWAVFTFGGSGPHMVHWTLNMKFKFKFSLLIEKCSNTYTSYIFFQCGAVTNVYGGQLLFEALDEKGQGWTSDLEQGHTQAFKDMAAKVRNAVRSLFVYLFYKQYWGRHHHEHNHDWYWYFLFTP